MDLNDWIDFLSWGCIVITTLGYLAGIPACFDMVVKKSTHNVPFLPFMLGLTSNVCCLWYGILIWDWPTLVCNSIGTTLHIIYVSFYLIFTSRKVFAFQLVVFTAACLLGFYLYLNHIVVTETGIVYQLGLSVSIFILVWNLSPFFEIIDVIHTKSSESLSSPLSLAMFATSVVWVLYGHAIQNVFIWAPSFPGILSGLTQLYLLHKYPTKSKILKMQ